MHPESKLYLDDELLFSTNRGTKLKQELLQIQQMHDTQRFASSMSQSFYDGNNRQRNFSQLGKHA